MEHAQQPNSQHRVGASLVAWSAPKVGTEIWTLHTAQLTTTFRFSHALSRSAADEPEKKPFKPSNDYIVNIETGQRISGLKSIFETMYKKIPIFIM